MYVHITNQEIDFLNKSASEPFVELFLKVASELHDFIWDGIIFQRDAPENEKLVLKRSVLGLGRVVNWSVAQVLEQIKWKYIYPILKVYQSKTS